MEIFTKDDLHHWDKTGNMVFIPHGAIRFRSRLLFQAHAITRASVQVRNDLNTVVFDHYPVALGV